MNCKIKSIAPTKLWPPFQNVLMAKLAFFRMYYGSHTKASKALGFGLRTWTYWRRGLAYPRRTSMMRIDAAYLELYRKFKDEQRLSNQDQS